MYKLLLLLLVLSLSFSCAYGQDLPLEKRLDELFTKNFTSTYPGCAVLVAKGGQIVYNKAFGSADLELKVPLSSDMVFKLGSITKQFTAVAILQLVEQGKVSLQDSVQKFIPDFPSKEQIITIENLLTHTSGIKDFMQIDYSNPYMERWDFTPKQLIDSFKTYPLEFPPGTKYSYSNSGYFLLGYIIERVSGKSYQTYVQEAILTPLALAHTYFDDPNAIIPYRVKGYRKEKEAFKNADFLSPSIAYAAGSLLSTTEDLFKWHRGVLAYKLIRKETLEKAFTPFRLKSGSEISYGYGWQLMNQGHVKSIEHGGKIYGFTTNAMYYPEQDVFIATLFNYEDALKDDLSRKLSETALGRSLQAEINKSDSETLSSYIGTYTLTTDTKRTIVIQQQGDRLFAKISGQNAFELLFQTVTKFQLKNIKDATGEFIKENGRVEKMIIHQNGQFEWKKTK